MAKHILIVDDDAASRLILARVLEDSGYTTQVAKDGEEAMRCIEMRTPDLLVTDCFLPKMDGVHLCKFVRADPRYRKIPLILISGTLEPELLKICRAFGIDAVFEKGDDTSIIVEQVSRLLGDAGLQTS